MSAKAAKARGSTTPAIFVTALFDTFDEDVIKRALTAKGKKEDNLRALIQSNPEFPYAFKQEWRVIRDLIDKKHPNWNIAEAANKVEVERTLKKWSGTHIRGSGRYTCQLSLNDKDTNVGTFDLEVDASDGSETNSS